MKQETSLASSLATEAKQELQTVVITAPERRDVKTINIHPQCIHSNQIEAETDMAVIRFQRHLVEMP
jgi:hypothetical protein